MYQEVGCGWRLRVFECFGLGIVLPPAGPNRSMAPQAISAGPRDTAVLLAPAEESSAGASHLTASQPRTPPLK